MSTKRNSSKITLMDYPAPLASVVIVNYNGAEFLQAAVESVLAQTIVEQLEIILVDNGSVDGSAQNIEAKFASKVNVLYSSENLGFAEGNNLGFAAAKGRYLLLLNNDAVADPQWAEVMIAVAEREPDIGMVTPKILLFSEPSRLDCAGHNIYRDGLNRSVGNLCFDGPEYQHPMDVFLASGCACLYRKDAVDRVGGFDERFFAYGDDTDLGFKLRLQGLRCLYVPDAVVLHHSSATSGKVSLQKIYWIERNRVWVLLKYYPVSWILTSPWFTFKRLWKAWWTGKRKSAGIATDIVESHSTIALLRTLLKAWIDALFCMREMIEKRRALAAMRDVSARKWKEYLKRYLVTDDEMSFCNKETDKR